MKITVASLICLFLITAFAGVQPMARYKDMVANKVKEYVVDEIPQNVQTPVDTKMSVEADYGTRFGLAYRVTLMIMPSPTAKLDTTYRVEVTSPYLEWDYGWDILWSENPGLRALEARGFHNIERSFLITQDDPLYEYIGQLEYRKFVQMFNAWTMSEIEAEYQNELRKLIDIRVIR